MRPSILFILLFFLCNISANESTDSFGYPEQEYSPANNLTVGLPGYLEILEAFGIPITAIESLIGIGENILEYLTSPTKMPDEIKTIFGEVLPHVHLINRKENITDGNLTAKCCGKYGCFSKELPFGDTGCRPISMLPFCQDDLKVEFYLWTRDNPISEDVIDPEDINTLRNSHFRQGTNVVMNINGYLGRGDMSIVLEMKDAILNKTDCNFISVDWRNGSHVNYTKAVANSQMVSAVTAYFVEQIKKYYNVTPNQIHIIGSSLGAHIAGGVGKRIPEIGRITGLDPAKAFFEGCDSTVHITRSDAEFVDIIHTDIAMIGTAVPTGHLDIYVNGGSAQPPCFGFIGCDHPMALVYFIDSIKSQCPYYAYQCNSYDDFMMGKCNVTCDDQNSLCAPMGYHADQWKLHARLSPTLMFMATREKQPYCVYHYHVKIICADDRVRVWRYGGNVDKLLINIIGEEDKTGPIYAYENSILYTSSRVTTMVTSHRQVGKIKSIELRWIHELSRNKTVPLPAELCNDRVVISRDFCQNDAIYNGYIGICCSCPYNVTFMSVRNLETGHSKTFGGKTVKPFEDVLFE